MIFEQKFPEGKIIRCPGKEAIESLFMSAVKEVTTVCKVITMKINVLNVIAPVLIFFEVVFELHYQNACYFLL